MNAETFRKVIAGHLTFYPESAVNRTFWKEERVPLRNFEFRLLVLLKPGSGQLVSLDFLQESMSRHGFVSPIRSSVSKLRRTFRKMDSSFDEIESEWGVGYEWKTY